MELVIHCMGMPFNGDTIKKRSLGGSESAAYYLAREMAARGHRVSIFTMEQKEGRFDGVAYCWAGTPSQQHPLGDKFEFYASGTPHDVLLVQRHPMGFHKRWAAKVCLHQMHDLALHRQGPMIVEGAWQVDRFLTVSEWHKKQLLEVYGLNPASIAVVRNAVDPTLYAQSNGFVQRVKLEGKPGFYVDKEQQPKLMLRENEFNMLYQARPERGLEHLVRAGGIMAQLAKSAPQARLLICGYDNTVPEMRDYYGGLIAQAEALPNVTVLGALDKPSLAQLQMACDLMLYPTEFQEVSCISAIEAMHAGLPMLSSDAGALSETCKDSGTTLLPLAGGRADEKAFVRWIEKRVKTLHTDEWWPKKHEKQLEAAKSRTWQVVATQFEAAVDEVFAQRKTPANMLRHFLDHSDVSAFDKYESVLDIGLGGVVDVVHAETKDAIHAAVRVERNRLYGFIENPAAFKAHYLEWQKKYYDENPGLAEHGEDCTGTARFRGVHELFDEAVQLWQAGEDKRRHEHELAVVAWEIDPQALDQSDADAYMEKKPVDFVPCRLRVLDFGCAHGHYTIPLASMYQQIEFVGMDISPDAVNVAARWAARDKLPNVSFVLGTQTDLGDLVGAFDIILAAEVVEHVYDWRALLQAFGTKLATNGALLLTTPTGRWEWNGVEGEAYWKGREHVHHFEYYDLQDMFKGSNPQFRYAPAGQDVAGGQLGSWVTLVRPSLRVLDVDEGYADPLNGRPILKTELLLGSIDYTRKFKYTAPRQTVSACMIVKNGEDTLRRCVSTFIRAVDELIIAVDPSTTDRTQEAIERLQEEFWYRPIKMIEGLKALDLETGGFAAARNRSMEPACGDWRFWCDADEEVRPSMGLWKFLRNSGIQGIGFPQVHYSSAPATVITTDYPTRLFRADVEAEFHGYVHEHPETVMGKGIEYSMIRGDSQILHAGYVDEATRRARFVRNYPLMVKDLKENPERKLNKFLMCRDIAQSLMFGLERAGFRILPGNRERALEGIKLYEEVVEWGVPRMIIDGAQYYSLCVEVAHGGFDAEIVLKTSRPDAPALGSDLNLKGRWHSRDFFFHVTRKLQEETTKYYESQYA